MTSSHKTKSKCGQRWLAKVAAGLALVSLILCVASGVAQGVFAFNNWGENGSSIAPVYGPQQANPHEQRWGNTADAHPPGTQVYSGELLGGDHYVEAWFSLDAVADTFALNEDASVVPDSLMTFFPVSPAVGLFGGGARVVPGTEKGPLNVHLQVRAWDSQGGRFQDWDGAWTAAQAGEGNAVGWSEVFWQPLTYGTLPPAGLRNFESFSLFIVPEPSAFALIGLGGVALLVFHRHRRERL